MSRDDNSDLNALLKMATGDSKEEYTKVVGSRVQSHWTYPSHFAHDCMYAGPQISIYASGWKAMLLSWFFKPRNPEDRFKKEVKNPFLFDDYGMPIVPASRVPPMPPVKPPRSQ